jgi:hypothetical protein
MFRRFTRTRLVVVGLAATGALALAVGAYAYFTSTGTSLPSSATAGNASTYTVTVTPTGSVTLYPTQTNDSDFSTLYQPYTGVVTNKSTGHQQVSQLKAAITGVDSAHASNCAATNFELYSHGGTWTVASDGQSATTDSTNTAGATTPALSDDMAGGDTLSYGDIAVYLADQSADQDGCQGATVSLTVTAS